MLKKNAIYKVTIYTTENTITVGSPLAAQINVTRMIMSDGVKATVKLYNLAPATRNRIYQDQYHDATNQAKWKYIHIEAGYGDENSLALIFRGRILQAYSSKSGGQTEVVTEIQAMALDIFDCPVSTTVTAGTTKKEALANLVSLGMPNSTLANVGNLDGEFLTDTTFDGNAADVINEIAGGKCFVDNGNVNVLMNNEVIDVPVPVVSDDSVLLETPIKRDANLSVKMLFHPDLMVGQLLEIKSNISPDFNGQYKVMGFTHDLTFGDGLSGTRTTTVELYYGVMLPGETFSKVKGQEVSTVNYSSSANWIMPCTGTISSGYGMRASGFHNGIDIAVPIGTEVKAIAPGKVKQVGKADGYGLWVWIDHGKINGKTVTSEYGHISSYCVKAGQKVTQGQVIAKSGNRGKSTGPHVHLTIRETTTSDRGNGVNPRKYISY